MSVSILGEHISLIRPERVPKPFVDKYAIWNVRKPRRKTIRLSVQDKISLSALMGYAYSGLQSRPEETC